MTVVSVSLALLLQPATHFVDLPAAGRLLADGLIGLLVAGLAVALATGLPRLPGRVLGAGFLGLLAGGLTLRLLAPVSGTAGPWWVLGAVVVLYGGTLAGARLGERFRPRHLRAL